MEKIEKWFGKVHVLRGVDFSVDEGEVVGLVGENGAGKSIGPIKIIDKEKQKIVVQLTSELGLEIESPEQGIQLCSGGEKQGTAIARALQYEAELLILEEPTVGLAPSGRRKIIDFVKRIKERKLGCIFSTPDIYRASPVADRFFVLVRGKIVEEIENTEDLDLEEVEELIKVV